MIVSAWPFIEGDDHVVVRVAHHASEQLGAAQHTGCFLTDRQVENADTNPRVKDVTLLSLDPLVPLGCVRLLYYLFTARVSKRRVTCFSEFAGSGLAITKVGMISFSCVVRVDSGHDPTEGDTLYLEIPAPNEGELEAIVEAVAWVCSQEALEVTLASRKPRGQQKTKAASISAVHHYEKGAPSAEDGMNEEARYFWCLQNIARATALQELNSIPRTDLKEMMAYITAFEVKYPEKAHHISKQVKKFIAQI